MDVNINGVRRGEKSSVIFILVGQYLSKPYEFENLGTITRFTSKLGLEARMVKSPPSI